MTVAELQKSHSMKLRHHSEKLIDCGVQSGR